MHHLKVILLPLLKDISSEIIHPHVAVNAMNNKLLSIYSQTVEQTEVISEVALSDVSKLIDSEIPRDKETKGNKIFLRKKGLQKIGNGLTINKHPEISYQLKKRVMKLSFHQFHKKCFHISKCTACNAEKTLELRKDNKKIAN